MKGSEPAFVMVAPFEPQCEVHTGLTKRELFAAMAMQGMMADHNVKLNNDGDYKAVAEQSVRVADALLEELG